MFRVHTCVRDVSHGFWLNVKSVAQHDPVFSRPPPLTSEYLTCAKDVRDGRGRTDCPGCRSIRQQTINQHLIEFIVKVCLWLSECILCEVCTTRNAFMCLRARHWVLSVGDPSFVVTWLSEQALICGLCNPGRVDCPERRLRVNHEY